MTTVTGRLQSRASEWPAVVVRVWRGLRFRDAILISLIPLSVLVYLVAAAVTQYRQMRLFDDFFSRGASVEQAFLGRWHAGLRLTAAMGLQQHLDAQTPDPAIIRLGIPGRGWDSLMDNNAASWDTWVHGTLEYGGNTIKAKFRRRGDTSVHWLTQKRSMTVRTPKDDFYKSYRTFGLSGKDVLSAWAMNKMGIALGVLSSRTELAPVFINNRFYGLYRTVEPTDESYLRPIDRMPGNIFRGDRAERGEYLKGQPRDLFANPYIWDRPAKSDRWTGPGSGQLRYLLEDLAGTTFEDAQRFIAHFEKDELARHVAFLLAAGDPYHDDGVHNQLLYEDPSTHLLHPIPWDIRQLPLDGLQHPLNEMYAGWLRDPFVVDAVTRDLAEEVSPTNGVRPVLDSMLEHAERRFAPYLAYDRDRADLIPNVGSRQEVMATLDRNLAILRRWLTDDTVAVGVQRAGSEAVLDIETRGLVGADLVGLASDRSARLRLWLDANLNGVHDASDPELVLRTGTGAGAPFTLARPAALYAGWTTDLGIRPGHIPYRFFVGGLPAGATLTPALLGRVGDAPVAVVPWAPGTPIRPASAWHPWRYPHPVGHTIRLAGAVRLNETLKVPAEDTLVIAPGTTLRLAPDVSIVARGRVIARGTPSQRIRIIDDVPGKPWGSLVFFGPGADSSALTWADVSQGGGALIDGIEYTGMVNVHRGRGVLIDHDFLHDNVRSDDTFHALHSAVIITNTHFLRANGDAIDFDISTGIVTNDTIENSGNDGLDLMTSTPFIADNVITGSQDKGISIGEASRPIVFNNYIAHCVRGIEAKDRSEPLILNNELDSNGVGLRERRKNWRYGGGPWTTIALTRFVGNGITHDVFSRQTLWGTAGVDSLEERARPQMTDMSWLYARLGLRPDAARLGRVAHWSRVPPAMPADSARFHDDLASLSDEWVRGAGATRLEKRNETLVMDIERGTGTAAKPVNWQLPAGGRVIVEVAGRDLSGGRLVATSATGEASTTFGVSPTDYQFRFVSLPLPAGNYRELRIEATPSSGLSHSVKRSGRYTGLSVVKAGKLYLRGYSLYPAR